MADEYERVERSRAWRANPRAAAEDGAAPCGRGGLSRRRGTQRQRRRALMGGPTSVPYPREFDVDIPNADHRNDVDWVARFLDKIKDLIWCRGLRLFEAAVLLGRAMPGGRDVPRRPTWETLRERKLRHVWGRFVGHEESYDGAYDEKMTPHAVRVTPRWNEEMEVPFSLKVGTPLPARLWAEHLMARPMSAALRDEDPRAYAKWCALHTLYLQDVAAKMLEAVAHKKLHYLPPFVRR